MSEPQTALPGIKTAFEKSRANHKGNLPESEAAPEWSGLPLGMRLALVDAYFQGRSDMFVDMAKEAA